MRWLTYYMPDKSGRLAPVSGHQLSQVYTLVFPLDKAGNFKSKVTNLRVTNAIK